LLFVRVRPLSLGGRVSEPLVEETR
jgi:hypothetical protein